MNIIQALQAVRDIYIKYPQRYEQNQEELRKVEAEIQDVLHIIELTTFNASDGYKWAKELQRLRKVRRDLKNELEELEKVKEFASFQRPTEKNISKIIGDIRHIENRQSNRKYSMRMRKELQDLIK